MNLARHGRREQPGGEQDAHAPAGPTFIKVYTEGLLDDETLKPDEKLLIALILSLSRNSRRVCFATREYLGAKLAYRGDYVHRIVKKINRKFEAGKTAWRVHVTYRHLTPGKQRSNLWRVLIPYAVLTKWTFQRDAMKAARSGAPAAESPSGSADNCTRFPEPERGQVSALSADNSPRLSAHNCARNKSIQKRTHTGAASQPPALWRDPDAWDAWAAVGETGGDAALAINRGVERREIVCYLHGLQWRAVVGARQHPDKPGYLLLDIEAKGGADPDAVEPIELLKRELCTWVFLSAWPKGKFPT